MALPIFALLLLTALSAAGCGGGESSSAAAGTTDTRAVLRPVGDSKASGVAIVHTNATGAAVLHSKEKTLAIHVKGIEPTGSIEQHQYAVWLSGPNKEILIGTYRVGTDEELDIEPTPLVPFMTVNLAEGSTPQLLITDEVPPKFRAAMAEIATFAVPSYMGSKTLVGTFKGPAVGG